MIKFIDSVDLNGFVNLSMSDHLYFVCPITSDASSTIYTDSFKSYVGLSNLGYDQECVNHLDGEWIKGECHINNCENKISILRPWLEIPRGICKNNISLYLTAFKTHRRSRKIKPTRAIIETLKIIHVILATKYY